MKRLWKTACAGLLAAWGLVCGGNTALAEVDGNWEYSYSDSDFTATVTKYTGSLSSPTIPSKFSRRVNTGEKDEDGDYIYKNNTYTVIALRGTFRGNQNITSVSIPSGVTAIGSYTFAYCSNLTTCTLSSSLRTIDSSAFENCSSLSGELELTSVKIVGSSAFKNCFSLIGSLTLSVAESIGASSFDGCKGFSSVTTSTKLKTLGAAFKGCSGLREATIDGDGSLVVTYDTFRDCTSLETCTFGDGVKRIQSAYSVGAYSPFFGCTNLKEVSFGSGIETIPYNLFEHGGKQLQKVSFSSVTNIQGSAFRYCSNLSDIPSLSKVKSIGYGAFEGCSSLVGQVDLSSAEQIDAYAFKNCPSLGGMLDLTTAESIGGGAFEGCKGVSSVTTSTKLKTLGAAFKGCSGLREATIDGDGSLVVTYDTFRDCTSLETCTFGDGVKRIQSAYSVGAYSPFFGCTNLKEVSFGNRIETIPYYLFYIGCSELQTVSFSAVTNIQSSAFQNCSNLRNVSSLSLVKYIDSSAFENCTSLEGELDLASVAFINSRAFKNCGSLTGTLNLPIVESIGYAAFAQCRNIHNLQLSPSLSEIESDAFQNCSSLSNVCFKGGVPTVGSSPFAGVASGARGHYLAGYAAEWLPQIGSDGKWQGLLMAEIPGPVLRVDSANPAEGSLTLAWDEPATVEGVTYSVYRSANDTYSATDLVTNGLTGTTWTDTAYWSTEPVLKPLSYWVVADGGGYGERASNRIDTRHRYGLCVGYDAYGVDSTPLRQSLADARLCHSLAESTGFAMEPVLKNSAASIEGIHNALIGLAQKAKPGDSVLFYIATHGGIREEKDKAVLIAYDGQYNVTQLASDVAAFDTGVGFIGIIMACHSQAMAGGSELSGAAANWLIENGLAMCTPNVAWVTSCGTDESSYNLEGSTLTMFGEWFLNQGWQNSHADDQLTGLDYGGIHGDGKISLLELTEYATLFAKGISDEKPSHVYFQNEGVLEKTIVADGISSTGTGGPDVPASITASQGMFDSRIEVSWATANGALWYWLYVLKNGCSGEAEADWKCLAYYKQQPKFMHKGSKLGGTYQYRVRAVNGSGVSAPSPVAQGSRGTATMINWLQEKGKELGALVGETVAELAAMPSANGMSLEGCYVSGIDPLDSNASFEADLVREDGKWKAKPKGGEKEGRLYRVEGKKEMSDESWTDVTDVEDLEADGWHFFRLGVELAE